MMNNNLIVTYLSPFEKKEIVIKTSNEKEIIEAFKEIPWFENCVKIFSSHQSSESKDEEYVYNEFSAFSIKKGSRENQKTICFVSNSAYNTNFKEKELHFFIEYMRFKKVETSKLSRFFGGSNEKTKECLTHCKGVKKEGVVEIIKYFINGEHRILDQKIDLEGSYY